MRQLWPQGEKSDAKKRPVRPAVVIVALECAPVALAGAHPRDRRPLASQSAAASRCQSRLHRREKKSQAKDRVSRKQLATKRSPLRSTILSHCAQTVNDSPRLFNCRALFVAHEECVSEQMVAGHLAAVAVDVEPQQLHRATIATGLVEGLPGVIEVASLRLSG